MILLAESVGCSTRILAGTCITGRGLVGERGGVDETRGGEREGASLPI